VKILLIGFGVVGQGFVELLRDKAQELAQRYHLRPVIVGVATRSQGTLFHPEGLNLSHLLDAAAAGGLRQYPDSEGVQRGEDIKTWIQRSEADVLIEASATNLETGQPALDYCMTAFEAEMHVILANKGPIALAYNELRAAAHMVKRVLRFEATVMAGTPSLALALDALAGSTVLEARGILNGTTNYILTQMHQGQPYPEALAEAQRLGYAETDPRGDVEGWDAAGKLLILAATVFETRLTMHDLQVTGITGITTQDIIDAKQAGECYKLIAHITPQGGSVQPVRLPLSDPLASVSNALNALTLKTDVMGDITLIGPGAGRRQTGFALLADLLVIHRTQAAALE